MTSIKSTRVQVAQSMDSEIASLDFADPKAKAALTGSESIDKLVSQRIDADFSTVGLGPRKMVLFDLISAWKLIFVDVSRRRWYRKQPETVDGLPWGMFNDKQHYTSIQRTSLISGS